MHDIAIFMLGVGTGVIGIFALLYLYVCLEG